MFSDNPLISIITPSLNQSEFIEKTIKSVLEQNYKNYEHIIIDGGSNDRTLDILKKYPHLVWVSEKDRGQSDALNKGIKLAKGEILGWINSDDYYEKNIFSHVIEYFEKNKNCFVIYGDITYISDKDEEIVRLQGDKISYNSLLKNPDLIRQPSTFIKRETLRRVGYLDESLKLVMDLDLFLRIGQFYDFCYTNRNLSYYRTYPETKTRKFARCQVLEIYRVLLRNTYFIPFRTHKKLIGRFLKSIKIFSGT